MQIYFHSRLCSYLPRVPILVEGTVYIYIYIYLRLQTLFLNFYCFSIALSLKCQIYIGLVSSLNKKKGKIRHGIIMLY